MEISARGNHVTIKGNIKSLQDYQKIKETLDNLTKSYKQITIDVLDSISMTSSVIGYLNKLVMKDGIDLKLNVGNEKLIELLEDLNLLSIFNVKRLVR